VSAATVDPQVADIHDLLKDCERRHRHLSAVEHNNPAAIAFRARLTGVRIDIQEAFRYQDATERAIRLPGLIQQLQDLLALSADDLTAMATRRRGQRQASTTPEAITEAATPPAEPDEMPTEWHEPEISPEPIVEEPTPPPIVKTPARRKPHTRRWAQPQHIIPMPCWRHTFPIGDGEIIVRVDGHFLDMPPAVQMQALRIVDLLRQGAQRQREMEVAS
jgi:hypothetical protein